MLRDGGRFQEMMQDSRNLERILVTSNQEGEAIARVIGAFVIGSS